MAINKIMSMSEAIDLINDGDQIIMGGWTVIRKPVAAAYEIIRKKKKFLHLATGTSGTTADLLIGAGCVSIGEGSYIGHERFGHAYNFWRAVEMGPEKSGFRYDDISLGMAWLRVQAAAMGLPFIPTMSVQGSDILNPDYDSMKDFRDYNKKLPRKKYEKMIDPFWDKGEVILVPAYKPDVAIVHVHEASADGTARINNCPFGDRMVAMAAKKTIVTTEKIVPVEQLCEDSASNTIPGMCVAAVVEVPYGAHPTQMDLVYDYDPLFYAEYVKASKKEETFKQWLDEWVFGVKDQKEYIQKIGKERLDNITPDPQYGYNPNIRVNGN